jgi:short-subunit dehydrogenase involved in D-alanine esterification of teichoic acids
MKLTNNKILVTGGSSGICPAVGEGGDEQTFGISEARATVNNETIVVYFGKMNP